MAEEDSIYSFSVTRIDGTVQTMQEYNGQVLLIVNTASKGNGKHMLKKLEKLHNQFKDRGFTVMAFPCRQFMKQEHRSNDKIKMTYIDKRKVTFPVFTRVKVNGKGAHPMFKWLKHKKHGSFGKMIGWSFTKFLVYCDGTTIKRFESAYNWSKMVKRIERALQDKEWKEAAKMRISRMNAAVTAKDISNQEAQDMVVPPPMKLDPIIVADQKAATPPAPKVIPDEAIVIAE